jgi:hypothetical protein
MHVEHHRNSVALAEPAIGESNSGRLDELRWRRMMRVSRHFDQSLSVARPPSDLAPCLPGLAGLGFSPLRPYFSFLDTIGDKFALPD